LVLNKFVVLFKLKLNSKNYSCFLFCPNLIYTIYKSCSKNTDKKFRLHVMVFCDYSLTAI